MSSILETFYFMFASNADDVEKGNKRAKDSANKVEEALKNENKQTQQVGKAFLGLAENLQKAAAAYLAFQSIQALTANSISATRELRFSSMAINENASDIAAWGRAVVQFGGDASSLQGTLKSLNNNIREAAFSGEGSMSPALRRLGINLRERNGEIKTTLQLLPEISKAFTRIRTDSEVLHLGGILGLDQATILLLRNAKGDVNALIDAQKQLGVVTEKDLEAEKNFSEQLAKTSASYLYLRQQLVTAVLPSLTRFFEKLEVVAKWMDKNSDLVEGFFIAVAGVVTAYYIPAMLRAAVVTLAATWPLLAIIAVVGLVAAAFALVYDEVKNFANGHNSLIGEAAKRWPLFGKNIDVAVTAIKTLIAIAKELSQFLFDAYFRPQKALDTLISKFKILSGFFGGKFEADAALKAETSANLNIANDAIALASNSPIASQTSNSLVSNRVGGDTSVSVGQVTVVTQSTDAPGIAAAVGTNLRDQLRQAVFNADDGMRI